MSVSHLTLAVCLCCFCCFCTCRTDKEVLVPDAPLSVLQQLQELKVTANKLELLQVRTCCVIYCA
jgi:hypothetical protein